MIITIPPTYKASANLLAHWKCDDGSDTTVTDSSGNGYDLTHTGTPTAGIGQPTYLQWPTPAANDSFEYAGGIPNIGDSSKTHLFTARVYLVGLGTTTQVILANRQTAKGFQFQFNSSELAGFNFQDDVSNSTYSHDTAFTTGAWHFVAGGYDALNDVHFIYNTIGANASGWYQTQSPSNSSNDFDNIKFYMGARAGTLDELINVRVKDVQVYLWDSDKLPTSMSTMVTWMAAHENLILPAGLET